MLCLAYMLQSGCVDHGRQISLVEVRRIQVERYMPRNTTRAVRSGYLREVAGNDT